MKVTIDLTPEEFQQLFVPSDKQTEFTIKAYDAYVDMFNQMMMKNIDPHNMFHVQKKTKD